MTEKKKNTFWNEHYATIVPLLEGAVAVLIIAGIYFGAEQYNRTKAERQDTKANEVKKSVAMVRPPFQNATALYGVYQR